MQLTLPLPDELTANVQREDDLGRTPHADLDDAPRRETSLLDDFGRNAIVRETNMSVSHEVLT